MVPDSGAFDRARCQVGVGGERLPGMMDLPASPSMKALAMWNPTATPLMDLPPMTLLSGGFSIPSWMATEFQMGETRMDLDAFQVLASVGTLYRLWSPVYGKESDEAMVHAMAGTDGGSHLQRWVRALPMSFLESAVPLAVIECDMIWDELDRISLGDSDPDEVFFLAERRDILQGVRECLRWVGLGAVLDRHLQNLDRAFAVRTTWIRSCQDVCSPVSPRLWAVSWQCPAAWWGKLVQ